MKQLTICIVLFGSTFLGISHRSYIEVTMFFVDINKINKLDICVVSVSLVGKSY